MDVRDKCSGWVISRKTLVHGKGLEAGTSSLEVSLDKNNGATLAARD